MKYFIIVILFIIILAIAITLGSDNNQLVTFNYLLAKMEVRLSTLIAIVFGAGFLVAWLLSFVAIFKLKLKLTMAQRKLKSLEKSVSIEKNEQKKQDLMSVK